jgi:hypothetical protein
LDIAIEHGLSVAWPSGEVDVSTAPVPAPPLAARTSEMGHRLVLALSDHDFVDAAGVGAPSLRESSAAVA